MSDERIAEIEETIRTEAGLSMVVGTVNGVPGWFALSFPVGHAGGVVIGTPTGTGPTDLAAAESLLAEWESRRA